jgi:type IX secretion system PorP/SprF family membrane protein
MLIKLTTYIFFIGFLIQSNVLYAQDVHFSQFVQTPQLINPAATGSFNGSIRGILNYKTQWSAFGSPYKTYAASVDLPVAKGNGKRAHLGLGGNFYKDVAGDANFGNFLGSVSIAGILPISDYHRISVGIQAGLGQYSADIARLTWGNQFDGKKFDTEINSNEVNKLNSKMYPDIGAGLFYEFKNTTLFFLGSDLKSFNIGVAAFHINQPKQDFLGVGEEALKMKIVGQFSGTFDISNSKVALVPSMFYARQLNYQEIMAGMLFKLRFGEETKYSGMFKQSAFYFGAHYRINDAIVPQIYLEFADYMIGLSYDYNTSSLSDASHGNGGFEISLKYVNKPKAIQRSSF